MHSDEGIFLAGMGLSSGQELDALASDLNPLLVEASAAIEAEDSTRAINAIQDLAQQLFSLTPFIPDPFPTEWRDILETMVTW